MNLSIFSERCNFGDRKGRMPRSQIILRIRDKNELPENNSFAKTVCWTCKQVQEKLLENRLYARTVKICWTCERAQGQRQETRHFHVHVQGQPLGKECKTSVSQV